MDTIRLNELTSAHYVEPYAGGAGAALNLLLSNFVEEIHINDKDPCIHSFWKSVLEQTEEFARCVHETPVSMNEWRKQRQVLQNPHQHSTLEIGFATFFINRCSHSGVLNGGPIGGYDQKGTYKIDARFYREELIRRIELIGLYAHRIRISNLDGIEFMRGKLGESALPLDRTLVYMDPPYYIKGNRLYAFFFNDSDHENLAEFLLREVEPTIRWVLSCDRANIIRRLYPGKLREIRLKYSVNSAKVGREFVISNCAMPRRLRPFRDLPQIQIPLCRHSHEAQASLP